MREVPEYLAIVLSGTDSMSGEGRASHRVYGAFSAFFFTRSLDAR